MLISCVSDGKESKESGDRDMRSNNCEYDTANELFDIMAQNHQFDEVTDQTLTAGDLVILYKNLDISTNMMTKAKYSQTKPSNQYVETVVYNDEHDSDEYDVGGIYSTEDIRNIMMINKERIDLLSNTASFDNTLCQKFGNIAMNSLNLATTYDKHFIFKDPYIKEQLESIMPAMTDSAVLPSSLLDYICCKRLEDNYNFYMDNIIRYVQHTIEQLKRISNGDYLTAKAKEMWRQDDHVVHNNDAKQTVLANSVSIPLHVERKFGGIKSRWDDAVHSEVDIRSLSKILKKRIVVEIPRLICGTYKLFSKRYNDNLIISCKKESNAINETHSRVDVVLKLRKSESGQAISKLNSIMVLQTSPQISIQDSFQTGIPSIMCDQIPDIDIPQVVEINEGDLTTSEITNGQSFLTNQSPETYNDSVIGVDTDASSVSFNKSHDIDYFQSYPAVIDTKSYSDEQTEANFRLMSPDELRCCIRSFNMNSPVPEEGEIAIKKKKSSTKVRIKSPYENSSHAVEEKKRRRLLEIRERREIKKKSLNEHCKISKHKYAKGAVMAQASSSVTKLSITNKSFYNSIYGQALSSDSRSTKKEQKIQNLDMKVLVELECCEEESNKKSPRSSRNKEKYINHSYYLDDADTEVMHLKNKQKFGQHGEACTASSSGVSDDYGSSLNLLKDIISLSNLNDQGLNMAQEVLQVNELNIEQLTEDSSSQLKPTQGLFNVVPVNTPKESPYKLDSNKVKDLKPSVECRKSIDKIYDLMNRLSKVESPESNMIRNKQSPSDKSDQIEDQQYSCSLQPSDSGTSFKHHTASAVPSCFSFEKSKNDLPPKKNPNKKSEIPICLALKVPTTGPTKSQTRLPEERHKRDRRKVSSPVAKISENPLKAISQLLREFENVQKSRHRTGKEIKSNKKWDADKKNCSRQVTFRKPLHHEPNLKDNEPPSRVSTPNDKKSKVNTLTHAGRPHNAKPVIDEKPVDKLNKRIITDIIDEVKEARGEAVRGPPKSRLDSLAQPKRPYNQPHYEQFPNKSRNVVNRHQKSLNIITPVERKDSLNVKLGRRKGLEISGPHKPRSTASPLGVRRSESSSPIGKRKRSPVPVTGPSYKPPVPEAPETLLKKMVAVESYVNTHYGRGSPTRESKEISGAQKSRVPLIPTDIDIGSVTSSPIAEESTTLGKKLHYMIDTMISTTAPALSSLCEINENSISKESINEAFVDTIEQYEEIISNNDYPIDVFGDKSITTAVASLPNDHETVLNNNIDFNVITYDIQRFNSLTELARLENALYRRLSASTFQKRLRIKNLTLTPKHSLQQVLVLQSGDVGSLVVKSTLSQNFIKKSTRKAKALPEYNYCKPIQSKSHVDWTFANFPMQISTVEYSMLQSTGDVALTQVKSKEEIKSDDINTSQKSQSNKSDNKSNETKSLKESQQGQQAAIKSNALNPFQMNVVQFSTESPLSLNEVDSNQSQEKSKYENKLEKKEEIRDASEESNASQRHSESENKTEIIENTTSLDILVGLLNEIKNITTCQTHLTENTSYVQSGELKELEFILKRAEFLENSVNQSPQAIRSLNSLESLDQQHKISEIYITKCNDLISNNNPPHVDKEVNVNFSGIEYAHTLTDVPSRFFPVTVHHSTHVTSSLMGVINEPSEQSMYYFSDYHTLYCNSSFNKIIELPSVESRQSYHSVLPVLKQPEVVKDKRKKNKNETNVEVHRINASDYDPLLKVKRDILVTVYSILVMTVFAALSFPKIFLDYNLVFV